MKLSGYGKTPFAACRPVVVVPQLDWYQSVKTANLNAKFFVSYKYNSDLYHYKDCLYLKNIEKKHI